MDNREESNSTSRREKFDISSSVRMAPSNPFKKVEGYSKPVLAPARLGRDKTSGIPVACDPSSTHSNMSPTRPPTFTFPPPVVSKSFKLKPSVLSPPSSSVGVSHDNPFSRVPDEESLKSVTSIASHKTTEDSEKDNNLRNSEATALRASHSSPDCKDSETNTVPESTVPENIEPSKGAIDKIKPTGDSAPERSQSNILRPSALTSTLIAEKEKPTPVFVPLTAETSTSSSDDNRVNGLASPSLTTRVSSGGFIFGTNLENRATGANDSESHSMINGGGKEKTGNLFTDAATVLGSTAEEGVEGATGGACSSKSLVESSRELTEKEESLKRKYDEVEVVTGEEGESNVLQMMCKLFGFVNGLWQERGRGFLRLNDKDIGGNIHSRLVVRTQGTLTLMLNAKIWADMFVENPDSKSIRFTALDSDGQPKIYLVRGSPKDCTLLHSSLEYRIAESRLNDKERSEKKLKT